MTGMLRRYSSPKFLGAYCPPYPSFWVCHASPPFATGPAVEKARDICRLDASIKIQKNRLIIGCIQIHSSLTQKHHSIITHPTSANVHRIVGAGRKTRLADIGPSGEVSGKL